MNLDCKNMNIFIRLIFLFAISFHVSYSQFVATNGPGSSTVKTISVSGQYVFAGTAGSGVYYTTNEGGTWLASSNGLGNMTVNKIECSGSVVIACTEAGLYRSTANGSNWSQVNSGNSSAYTSVRYMNSVFYAGTYNGSIYKSTDNGATWTLYSSAIAGAINDMCIFNGVFFAAATGLHVSTNNGAAWSVEYISGPAMVLKVLFPTGNVLRLGTGNGGKKSTTPLGNFTTDIPWINFVQGYAWVGSYLIAGMSTGMFWSSDNGTTWNDPTPNYMQGSYVNCVTQSVSNVYAGAGNFVYKRAINEIIGITVSNTQVPEKFNLSQNYPNPFNPSTTIQYSLSSSQFVTLKVYDVLGNEISTLIDEHKQAGFYEVSFNASSLPSGSYFYRLQIGNYSETKKMLLLR